MKIEGPDQRLPSGVPSALHRVSVAPRSARPAFPELLLAAGRRLDEAAVGPRPVRMVRSGDTLSQMVEALLRESGMQVSPRAIYRAVADVASANRLADPDRIRPGERIDLSAAIPSASGGPADPLPPARLGERLRTFFGAMAGRLTSAFGPRTHPVTGAKGFHAGVDIGLPAGAFIYPPLPGRVIFNGMARGYGNLMILAHADGLTTSYGHNAANLIPVGTVVDQEVPIAVVGATGTATGPHLHFEVRKDGHPVDPQALLATEEDQHAQGD